VSNPITRLREEVKFKGGLFDGEPRIIFRRIRGRIVPIVNKRRIGRDIEGAGRAIALASGATAAGIVGAPKAASAFQKAIASRPKVANFFAKTTTVGRSFGKSLASTSDVRARKKSAAKAIRQANSGAVRRAASSAGKFAARNSLKIAVAGTLAGIVLSHVGFEIRARSKFGARF